MAMPGSTLIPTMKYRDAPAMIDWLCRVIGFERHAVYDDGKGGIAHAELTLGDGMIMLGSVGEGAFDALQRPADPGAAVTQSAYVIADPDAVHARAVEAGAEIVIAPRDEEHGGRSVSFRDPEGQLWNVGSYDPWA
jgi:uncharacterized glyoxalase superfamily protein PhnB